MTEAHAPVDASNPAVIVAVEAMLDLDHPVKVGTAKWAAAELAQGDRVERDRTAQFAADDWVRCAERGIQGLLVDPELGGQGRDLPSALLVLEGLGYGCRDQGLSYALASQIWSTQVALGRFGTDEQLRRWMPGLCDGSLMGAFAITEPESGSDTHALTSRAVETADGFRIDGHKAYITLATRCDFVVVFASTDPDAGRWGISAFIVPIDAPGVEVLGNRDKMGMRTTPFGDIVLDGVDVPRDAQLGPSGAGPSIFTTSMDAERAFVFATKIGVMERQLDEAVEFARSREQGGRPIARYQAVSHRLADMKVRHETARLFLYKAALASVTNTSVTMAAALTKIAASEAAVASALDATQLYGARGYVSEYEVERDLRDAVGGLVYSGTSDIQRNIVARLLGVG